MDFIELFNGVVTLAKPVTAEDSFAKAKTDQLLDLELDSLDTIMLSMYFGEIYGVDEDTMRSMNETVRTVGDLEAFLEQHKTRTPTSVKAALSEVK